MSLLPKPVTRQVITAMCVCCGITVVSMSDTHALSVLSISSANASQNSEVGLANLEQRLVDREQELLQLMGVMERNLRRSSNDPESAAVPLLSAKIKETTQTLNEIKNAVVHLRLYKASENMRVVIRNIEQQGRGRVVEVDAVPTTDISALMDYWRDLVASK